jgi:hypothetical protein
VIETCTKHYYERATGTCHDCGQVFCANCLVPRARRNKPLRCIDCALVAAGVRTSAHRPRRVMSL